MTKPMDWTEATFVVPGGEGAVRVSGFARYEFGVYEREICNPVTHAKRTVTNVIHLPSGILFGIFDTIALAKVAGRLADENLEYDFAEMDPDDQANEFDGVVACWLEAGLVAVNSFGDQMAIWHAVRLPGGVVPALGLDAWGPNYPSENCGEVVDEIVNGLIAGRAS